MENTQKILSLKTLYIFLLITLPMGTYFHDTREPGQTLLFEILNIFGYIMYMFWFYAIGVKGQIILKEKGIDIKELKVLNFLILLIISINIYFTFGNVDYFVFDSESVHMTLPKPIIIYIFSIGLIGYLKLLIAQIIVSIEKKKKSILDEYFKVFLLLLIPYIGILFVHYRVRESIAGIKN